MKTSMVFDLKSPKSNTNNKVPISGTIEVSELVSGQIDLALESNKCSLDMKSCEKFTTINVKDMCKKFKDALYSNAFSSIQPPLDCPIKPGNYTLKDSILDLSMFSLLPIDGFIYVASVKLVSSENGGKTKRIVFCMNIETKIMRIRVKS